MGRIGMLTIGQSPRDDVLPNIIKILEEGIEIIQAGALDGKKKEDFEKIEFKKDDYVLVSRLRDGTEVKITKNYVLPLLQQKIHSLENKEVDLTVIMCTGKFPKFNSKKLVITPQEILRGILEASLKSGKLGIIYPAFEQLNMAENEFKRPGVEIYSDWLSPYSKKGKLEDLSMRLRDQKLDLIFLNCFGFSSNVKEHIKNNTGVPTIQSNSVIARILKELL